MDSQYDKNCLCVNQENNLSFTQKSSQYSNLKENCNRSTVFLNIQYKKS